MHNPNFSLFPLLALFLPAIPYVAFAANNNLYTNCLFADGYFNSSDIYAQNLNELFDTLSTRVPPTGFGLGTAGYGNSTVHGLALCRGDISSSTCKKCVRDSASALQRICTSKEAITWFDYCMVRYASRNFFGAVDDGIKDFYWSLTSVSNLETFNPAVVSLLNRVALKAYKDTKFFGTGEAGVVVDGKKKKLYALTQCTRDISASDCNKCLKTIIGDFPDCCSGRKGGRVLSANCNFRYELYPFY